mgnify:CR=1 FL=1
MDHQPAQLLGGEGGEAVDNHEEIEQRLSRDKLLRLRGCRRRSDDTRGPPRCGASERSPGSARSRAGSRCSTGRDTETTAARPCSRGYVKAHPKNKPQFSYMANESDALAKIHAGAQAGPLPPLRRLGQVLRDERPRPALGPEADPELQAPEPVHGQGRPVQGQAVRHPQRLGLRRDPLPERQGHAQGPLVGAALRRPLQGQDRVVRRPRDVDHRRSLPRVRQTVAPDRRRSSRSPRSCS